MKNKGLKNNYSFGYCFVMALLEEEKVIEGANGTLSTKYLARLSPISQLDYRGWLFGQPHSLNKDKLLELTLLPFPPEERSIAYFQMSHSDESFKKILATPLLKLPNVLFTRQWYTYEHPGHFYVDFANPHKCGGDFRSWGNVQEE